MKKNQIYGLIAIVLGLLTAVFLFVGGDFVFLGETDFVAGTINSFDLFGDTPFGTSYASASFGFILVAIGMITAAISALALIAYGVVLFLTGDKYLGLNKILVIVAGALILVPFIGAVIVLLDADHAEVTFQAIMWAVIGVLSIVSAFVTPKLVK